MSNSKLENLECMFRYFWPNYLHSLMYQRLLSKCKVFHINPHYTILYVVRIANTVRPQLKLQILHFRNIKIFFFFPILKYLISVKTCHILGVRKQYCGLIHYKMKLKHDTSQVRSSFIIQKKTTDIHNRSQMRNLYVIKSVMHFKGP